jgi:ubiquitin-protein ligase E3 C
MLLPQHFFGGKKEIYELKSCDVFSTEEGPPLTMKEVRTMTILRELPFLVAFQERVLVFQSLVLKDKLEHQGDHRHFLQGPNIHVAVRRNYLYEDAFDKLSPENGKPTIL